jgi:hypothetical protein
MSIIDLSKSEIEQWRSEAAAMGSVSQVLRKISVHYKINKFEVASLASDIFEEVFSGEDMQALWKWDMGNANDGFNDREVDALLQHLLQ